MPTHSMASKVIYSVIAVVGIAAASGAAWWYQSKPSGPKEITAAGPGGGSPGAASPAAAGSAPRAAGVEVAKVERATLQDDAQSVGSLRSRQSVMMRPEVAGRVKELGFSDGATVRKGQMLVQLDDTLQKAEIKQAQAQVSIAQANYKRNQELVAQSFVAQRVLEESSANLQVAEAQLALACARLSRMAIMAPFDGTVGIRNINLGDFVKDGADLINLEDLGSMYVDFRLPERYQNKLRARQSVELQLDSFPGRIFKATVEAIDPLLDVNGRSVGVRAVLPNTMGEPAPQGGGRPGGPGGPPGPGAAGAAGKPSAAASGPAKPGDVRAAAPANRPSGATRPARPASAPSEAARPVAAQASVDANGCPTAADGPAAATGRPGGAGTSVAGGPRSGAPGGAPQVGARAGGPLAAAGGPGGSARGGAGAGGNPAPLRPGMFARVTTVFAIKTAALVVPEEAIVPQGGRQFVIKVVEPPAGAASAPSDAKLVSARQEVKLGARQLGRVEITDGLAEGDTVVVAGQQRLQRDGTAVRVVELGRPPAQGASAAAPARAAASSVAAAPSP